LQTDRAGNFYFGTGGNQLGPEEPWHGPVFKVSADGAKIEPVARGFRAPNGLTIGPDDAIYVAENQGQWIPSSKISRVRRGGFYGFVADPKNFPKAKRRRILSKRPMGAVPRAHVAHVLWRCLAVRGL
jgi:sugar lactone lactonase YvrE